MVMGPQIGINVGSNLKTSGNDGSNPAVLSVKKGDFGFAYGAGFDFGLNPEWTARLGLGFRGVLGLINISDHSNTIESDAYYILDKAKIKSNAAYIRLSFIF
jgi:opacity protein-like surface antigen